jgi:uncharacterized protein
MHYLIDGHNLIPHVRGMSLSALDDEMALVGRLQEFCRVKRAVVEVYFDRGQNRSLSRRPLGRVTAIFVPQGTIADEAIRQRLHGLGKAARNWTVVSADRQVQAEARAVRAQVVSSEAFADELDRLPVRKGKTAAGEPALGPDEVEEWMRYFQEKNKSDK